MSQNDHLVGVWLPGSFIEQRGGEVSKSEKPLILQLPPGMTSLRKGCVNFFFLEQSTGGHSLEQRHFGLTFR